MTQLALATLRCARCDSRNDLLTQAVLEAARAFMAQYLVEERRNPREVRRLSDELHQAAQDFRDSLSAERRARS